MPKQFLPIVSDKPMLIESFERVEPISHRVFAVCGLELSLIAKQFLDSVPKGNRVEIIEEPAPHSTAPALGLAAINCEPDDIIAAFPSDHHIEQIDRFRDVILTASKIASHRDGIVCVGIAPTRPEPGYGYIRLGDSIDGPGFTIDSFVEKPPSQRAARLIEEGAVWNGGIFVVRAGVYLELVDRYIPELGKILKEIKDGCPKERFLSVPSISVDHGILEHCKKSFAVRSDFHWDDLGDWGAMERIFPKDASGNSVRGKFVGYETKHLIVDTDVGLVGAVGVEDIAIIRHEDVVLVVKRGMEQNVRELLALLKNSENKDYL